jgi:hypothetical protein
MHSCFERSFYLDDVGQAFRRATHQSLGEDVLQDIGLNSVVACLENKAMGSGTIQQTVMQVGPMEEDNAGYVA